MGGLLAAIRNKGGGVGGLKKAAERIIKEKKVRCAFCVRCAGGAGRGGAERGKCTHFLFETLMLKQHNNTRFLGRREEGTYNV